MVGQTPEERSQYGEIHELVTASLLGQASPEEMARLEGIVRESAQARAIYLAYIAETGTLRTWSNQIADDLLDGEIDPSAILELLDEVEAVSQRNTMKKAAERTRKEIEEAARRRHLNNFQRRRAGRRPEPIVIPWSVVYATIGSVAAALVLLVHSYWPRSERQPLAQVENAPVQVATIVGSVGGQWRDPELPSSPGTRLSTGSMELTRGVVEVRLDDGAKAVIESPTTLEFLSAKSMRLRQGKLVGHVPPAAIGFTVETSLATIVDLGTEFGVAIDEQEAADMQVFEGEIKAIIQDSGRHVPLAKGRSVRVAVVDGQTRVADVPIDPDRFVRQLSEFPTYDEVVRNAKPILYWRFEAPSNEEVSLGGIVRNEMGDFLHGVIQQTDNVEANGLESGTLAVTPGNLSPAVVCDQPDVVPILDNYSVEFWMNPGQEHRGVIASFGSKVIGNKSKHTPHGILIEVCGPVALANGPHDLANRRGHLRFLHRSPPATNVRTGTSCYSRRPYAVRTWQHVVAVKDGPEMRLYIDGQLSGKTRDSSVTPSNLTLHVGQLHRYHLGRHFLGQIDELALYDRAVTEKEIHMHAKYARPLSPFGGTNQR